MARLLRHRQTKEAETDRPGLTSTAPHSYSTVKTIACGNAGRFRCTRCCSCAFYHYQVHTKPRVQRAPGIPHALPGGRKTNANLGRIAPRDHKVMFGTGADTVIPGRCEASNPESRDSGSGPADHPGMTVSGLQRHCERSEAIHSFSPCGFMDCFASLAMTAWLFEN